MHEHKIFSLPFARLYPLYQSKIERKGRTKEELDQVITWLTGYDAQGLTEQIKSGADLTTFFAQAPDFNPNANKITGVICGWRVEDMEEGLMKKIRYLDKLVDELARGKAMEKVLRQ